MRGLIKRRLIYIYTFAAIMVTLMCIPYVILCFSSEDVDSDIEIGNLDTYVYLLFEWCIVIFISIAIYRIHKFSRMLV